MRQRHAISPGFSSHYRDLGITRRKRHDSAYKLILGVDRTTELAARSLAGRGVDTDLLVLLRLAGFEIAVARVHTTRQLGLRNQKLEFLRPRFISRNSLNSGIICTHKRKESGKSLIYAE